LVIKAAAGLAFCVLQGATAVQRAMPVSHEHPAPGCRPARRSRRRFLDQRFKSVADRLRHHARGRLEHEASHALFGANIR